MRTYSLAYLTANASTVPEAIRIAADLGYGYVGLRVQPNGPGAPFQTLIGDATVLRETQAVMRDTGVGVYDLEIIRIGEHFNPADHAGLMDIGQTLGAKAVLVAADDPDESRLADHYARLCETMRPYGLSADLEFMPWTAVKDAKSAMRVIELAGRPSNAGVLVDALHFGRSSTTLQDIAAIPRAWLHYAQMCDAQAGLNFTDAQLIHTARQERLLPGEGSIDLQGLFATLPQDLPISVEIVNLERSAPIGDKAWAAQCLSATKKVLGDA
ncbi:MAG: sugar phosphate isomerase/epimerase [Limnohabitans sp.]|nr:sugar phosphate isomerase/epimerase [Limnohabitans sp.]